MLKTNKVGFIAGAFDLIHPGYIDMFKTAKERCDYLIVALHTNPNRERPKKLKPILNITERIDIVSSIRFVDKVLVYDTEDELVRLLKEWKPDIRFLGDDYIGKEDLITGFDLNIPIYYIPRSAHGWSTTKLKNMIYRQIENDTTI